MMYRLLIVDDEKWIRQGIRETIDWKSMGIGEVREAEDGGEALAEIERREPDVVITDIRMPDLDGLELIRLIKEKYPRIKVLIISGYQDFNYAREAVSLGACAYILKPIDEQSMIENVKTCLNLIETERRAKEEREHLQEQIRESIPIVYHDLIQKLFREGVEDEAELLAWADKWGLKLEAACYLIFIVKIHEPGVRECHSTLKVTTNRVNIEIRSWINRHGSGCSVINEDKLIYGYLALPDVMDREVLVRWFAELMTDIEQNIGAKISIGVSTPFFRLKEWMKAQDEARQALRRLFFYGKARAIFYEHTFCREREQLDCYKEEELIKGFKAGDRESLKRLLSKMKAEIMKYADVLTDLEVKLIYEGLIEDLYRRICEEPVLCVEKTKEEKLQAIKAINELETLNEIHQYVEDELFRCFTQEQELRMLQQKKIIQDVIAFINTNYHEKITLKSVSDQVYLNPCYLSKLFKKEVGETFTRFLMKTRVRKAKKLLADPRLKIYEIAQLTGFNDVKYFIKTFKEFEGISPKQYQGRYLPHKTVDGE